MSGFSAIRREVDRLNHAPMARGETRRALFDANERALLKPLPRNPWEWGAWIERKVGPNAVAWAERRFASRDFPEQALATVQGTIRLAEDRDDARIDALCAEALDLNRLASGSGCFRREELDPAGPGGRRGQAGDARPGVGDC